MSDISQIFRGFHKNGMKANQDKCRFLSSLEARTKYLLTVCMLKNQRSQKPLGVLTGN